MALNDIYQLNVVHILNGRETTNVFWYVETKVTTLTPTACAHALANRFFTAVWSTHWRFRVVVQCELTFIWCRRYWPTLDAAATQPFVDERGAVIEDSIPNGSAVLMGMDLIDDGIPFRKRSFISGVSDVAVKNSALTDGALTNMRGLSTQIGTTELIPQTDLTAEFLPAAFSKKKAAAADPKPWALLQGGGVTRNIRSQRRRNLTGRG